MLLSLPICVMFFTGSLFLSASPIELLHLYGGAFLAVLQPTCQILVDLSLTSQLVDLCVLQKGGSFWSRELTLPLDSVEPFRLWVPPSAPTRLAIDASARFTCLL